MYKKTSLLLQLKIINKEPYAKIISLSSVGRIKS